MIRPLTLLCLFPLLIGCLRTSTTVIVNTNGSATVIDTVLFVGSTIDFFNELVESMDSTVTSDSQPSMWNDSTLRKRAALMGEGVVFIGASNIQIDSSRGYVATYQIQNISNLKIDKSAFHSKMDDVTSTPVSGNTITGFSFADHTLTISNPQFEPEYEAGDTVLSANEALQQLEMARSILQDLSVTYRIRINGAITETNASHVNGNDVTLVEFHFSEVIDSLRNNPEIFQLMKGTPEQRRGDLEKAMNKLGSGARFETNDSVYVRFREE